MHHSTVIIYLSTALLTCKLAVCDWTFSLRISSAVCCNSATCEQVGTCDSLFVALCFRDPNTTREDRINCGHLIAGDGRDIIGRELTPSSFVTLNLEPAGITRQDTAYLGGFQIFATVLTTANDDNIIDELFVEVVSIAGGGESSMMAYGENGRVNVSLSAISVQCIEGFSGDDCVIETPNNSDFPTDRAAKLDIALSIVAAIVLISLVVCALFPISIVRLWRKPTPDDSQLELTKNPNVVIHVSTS